MNSKRSQIITIVVLPVLLFIYGLGTVEPASNVVHVLFGTMLLLFSVVRTVELATRVKYWAALPAAILIRQLIFVILPIALSPHASTSYRIGNRRLDSLFEGGLIISIENYALFVVIFYFLKHYPLRILPSDKSYRRTFLLYAGLAVAAVGAATKLAMNYGVPDFVGQSATKYWFGLGLSILLSLLIETRKPLRSYSGRSLFAGIVVCALAIPLAGTGSRALVFLPPACLLGVYTCERLERYTVSRLAAGTVFMVVLIISVFSLVAEVRNRYYLTGQVGSVDEVGSGTVNLSEGLQEAMYRLGASAAAAQIIVDNPGAFPQRPIQDVLSLFAGQLISKNIWDLEQRLGLSYNMNGATPSEEMAKYLGIAGGAPFPLSCDLYLAGGYGGVALGELLTGLIIAFLARCLNGIFVIRVILISLLAGVFFPGLAITETATELISLLMWNMWLVVLLSLLLQAGAASPHSSRSGTEPERLAPIWGSEVGQRRTVRDKERFR